MPTLQAIRDGAILVLEQRILDPKFFSWADADVWEFDRRKNWASEAELLELVTRMKIKELALTMWFTVDSFFPSRSYPVTHERHAAVCTESVRLLRSGLDPENVARSDIQLHSPSEKVSDRTQSPLSSSAPAESVLDPRLYAVQVLEYRIARPNEQMTTWSAADRLGLDADSDPVLRTLLHSMWEKVETFFPPAWFSNSEAGRALHVAVCVEAARLFRMGLDPDQVTREHVRAPTAPTQSAPVPPAPPVVPIQAPAPVPTPSPATKRPELDDASIRFSLLEF